MLRMVSYPHRPQSGHITCYLNRTYHVLPTGLAYQAGNQVTLCYRGERFGRIKERNTKRIEDCIRAVKVRVLFQANPLEFKPESVILEVRGAREEIPNDFVWIFAGGTPPNDFLKKIGVGFGAQDLTLQAGQEAKQVEASREQLAQAAAN